MGAGKTFSKNLFYHQYLVRHAMSLEYAKLFAVAGEHAVDYTTLKDELAEEDLAEKVERLRALPGMIKSAERDMNTWFSHKQ